MYVWLFGWTKVNGVIHYTVTSLWSNRSLILEDMHTHISIHIHTNIHAYIYIHTHTTIAKPIIEQPYTHKHT